MKCELQRALPSVEGIHPEYLINFLNACEKAESEIHGIMIARHGKVIFEGYKPPMQQISPTSCIPLPRS